MPAAPAASTAPVAAAVPAAAPKTNNIFDMLGSAPAAPTSTFGSTQPKPMFGGPAQTFGSVQSPTAMSFGNTSQPMSPTALGGRPPMQPTAPSGPNYFASAPVMSPTTSSSQIRSAGTTNTPSGGASKSSANFDDLWNMSLGSSSTAKSANNAGGSTGKSIKDLEREKAQATIWGSGGQAGGGFSSAPTGAGGGASGGGDLLF